MKAAFQKESLAGRIRCERWPNCLKNNGFGFICQGVSPVFLAIPAGSVLLLNLKEGKRKLEKNGQSQSGI
jgi:hypothetical protein